MSCGVVPTSSNRALYPQLSAARVGGGLSRPAPCRVARWARVSCSSSTARAHVAAEEVRSFYELLGIPESGSHDEIKRAYKQMALKYHPDVSPPERTNEFTRRFIEVQEAYETLSDPERRAIYDHDLARGLHLAFSHRRILDKDLERSRWRGNWQDQLGGLKRRSMDKVSGDKSSWAARMRRERGTE